MRDAAVVCRRGHWDVVEDDPRRAALALDSCGQLVGSYRGFSYSGSALMGASASIRPRHACCSPVSPALGGKPNPSRPRPGHRPCPSRRVTAAQLARRERSQIRLRQKHLASKIWAGVRVATELPAGSSPGTLERALVKRNPGWAVVSGAVRGSTSTSRGPPLSGRVGELT
jgi:hypothetical protein